ncbi:MAG: DegV family protein [Anaerolineales bacterium]|nr:DegV family protein [Anaerolineales bacterium]
MSKKKVALVIDSTANLPEEFVEKYNIYVIPLIVNWAGESLRDGVDITPTAFYERLTRAKEMPSTSQPSAGEFVDVFSKAAETAESILCLTISSELSGTFASANAARDMLEDIPIDIVDTRSTVMAMGFMALKAAEAIENGADLAEAAQVARDLITKVRILFVVDTLEFLHRGGRIGGASRLFGSVLSIKPVLTLENGRIDTLEKIRTKRKAIQYMLDYVVADVAGKSEIHAVMLNAVAFDDADAAAAKLQQQLNIENIPHSELSPVIGTHVGPGAIGIAYYAE